MKCKVRPRCDITIHVLECLKLKILSIPSVGKNVEELKLSYHAGEYKKWENRFRKVWLFYNKKSSIHQLYDPFIPLLFLPKIPESICPYKAWYMNVHNIAQIGNNPKSINR